MRGIFFGLIVIVVDASVLAPALAAVGDSGRVARARLAGQDLAAPDLIDLEVASAYRGLTLGGKLDAVAAARALERLVSMPIQRVSHRLLVPRCWELRNNLTCYDAAYVALAELLSVPLVTADARISQAPKLQCSVELL